jgi:hypothetical protein
MRPLAMSERQTHKAQQDRVAQLVPAMLDGADADVSNLTAAAIEAGPEQAIYALASLVVAAVGRLSSTDVSDGDALVDLGLSAFGRPPRLLP